MIKRIVYMMSISAANHNDIANANATIVDTVDINNSNDDDDDDDDDDDIAPTWLVNDVTNYSKNNNIKRTTILHQTRRPSSSLSSSLSSSSSSSSIQGTQSHKLSDADMKERMGLYKNYALSKLDDDKKIDPNDRIRDKLVEVLATIDNDDPNKDTIVNKILSQVEDSKRKRRETRLKQFEIAFGKSLTPRSPTELRKSSAVDTFNRASIINTNINTNININTHANSNNHSRASSISRVSINRGSIAKRSYSLASPTRNDSKSININGINTSNGEDMQHVLAMALAIQDEEEKKVSSILNYFLTMLFTYYYHITEDSTTTRESSSISKAVSVYSML